MATGESINNNDQFLGTSEIKLGIVTDNNPIGHLLKTLDELLLVPCNLYGRGRLTLNDVCQPQSCDVLMICNNKHLQKVSFPPPIAEESESESYHKSDAMLPCGRQLIIV